MNFFDFDNKLTEWAKTAEEQVKTRFSEIERIAEYNQQKVLAAFIRHGVSESHFAATTGYGYNDRGRDKLEEVFADVFETEDALVRHSILSGTHAIGIALFGVLKPGDVLLAATGRPYDTLHSVIGINEKNPGSLTEMGVGYSEVSLTADGTPDLAGIAAALKADPAIRVVHIQRSKGYDTRPSLSVAAIGEIVKTVRSVRSDVVIFVDDCYGEFVEEHEPTSVGADLMAGSLIKNAGGGIAENGGYICGKHELVERCSYRMTTPGLGREIGASLGHNRSLFMGLFYAPHVVGEALKTATFAAALFEQMGYKAVPGALDPRADIIQTLYLENPDALIAFCRGLQAGSPIDSFVAPEPSDMPGYDSEVIMAAGTFTMGASIELSADAPLRDPYAVFLQGGLQYHAGKIGVMSAAQRLLSEGLVSKN
ncbi:MAG: methionine gamma-lyase family protein [Clostridia bacterium]|nr:methionine gamma-lyase family protein [Clostridia bacterium]